MKYKKELYIYIFLIIFVIILLYLNKKNYESFNNNSSIYTAIIVEPRKHKALEFVLKNFLENSYY